MISNLPHFIIIGAMKCATSSLQEQLAEQAGIFMCDPKEPNFYSDDEQYARGLEWYTSLFSNSKKGDLLGEASTHYTKLPTYPNTISRMKKHIPDLRIVYVMRHPIDRLISHYKHEWTMGMYKYGLEKAVKYHSELIDYGRYAMQLKPFFDTYGKGSVLPVFFDRLIRDPQVELERVCSFIGYEGTPHWANELKPSNVSSERFRYFPGYSWLIDSGIATWLRHTLIPVSLRAAVKSRLTINQNQTLDNETLNKLEGVFDQDLAHLGDLLGFELNCKNFKEVTANNRLSWI